MKSKNCVNYFHAILLNLIVRGKHLKQVWLTALRTWSVKYQRTCRDQNTIVFAQLLKSKTSITEPRNTPSKFLVKSMLLPRRRRKSLCAHPSSFQKQGRDLIWEQTMPRITSLRIFSVSYIPLPKQTIASTTVRKRMCWGNIPTCLT